MAQSHINLLLVEDNAGDVRLIREALAEIAGFKFELIHCETLEQTLKMMQDTSPDLVLSDLLLPDADGLEAVRRIRACLPDVPLVVLTCLDDEELAIKSLQEGAQDYLVKRNISGDLLWRALRYAMERHRVQTELLNHSLLDDLTGLYNRKGFLALAGHRLKVACRTGEQFLVAFADLDGLKQINDSLGHQEGNRAIVDAANVLKDSFRQSDIIARLGGDEFSVFISEADESKIPVIMNRVDQKLKALTTIPGRRYELSLSMGVVSKYSSGNTDIETLVGLADALMYQQKHNKRLARLQNDPQTAKGRSCGA